VIENLRNIAIIAHVDHGKTTLVDELLKQSGSLEARGGEITRVMDSNDIEKERGKDFRINIVDTPGHADFGGEVERILSMVDCVLLLVDAVDGPMPQTRFVTQKAFALGLKPIVVINKIDRPSARPDWVLNQTFDLFDRLGATDEQLDFPVVYASALMGYASASPDCRSGDMQYLFETITRKVQPPDVDLDGPFQMQISQLDYNSYVGIIGIGRISRGQVDRNSPVKIVKRDGSLQNGRVMSVFGFHGLQRIEVETAYAGDIVAITGIDDLGISDTLCHPGCAEALPPLSVDEPTVSMNFQVNKSPFAGRDGQYLTSRQVRDRLMQELKHNVALRVEMTEDPDKFKVSGRGELHLGILIENMRREGYELAVSRPEVVVKTIDGQQMEPYEQLVVDIEQIHQGAVMEKLGLRKADLKDMVNDAQGRVRLEYVIPSRGLIGFQTEFMTATSGTGLIYHVFDHYGPIKKGAISARQNGVMISTDTGKVVGYALFNLQERGRLFLSPGDDVYEGMLVGIHARDNDLVVNPMKSKQLTNFRASGSDENILLTPPVRFSLEQAIEFIDDDELVEITPLNIRLRKKLLKEHERKRASRTSENPLG
jgi:GTP-binding protein